MAYTKKEKEYQKKRYKKDKEYREKLIKEIQIASFAVVETNLYLDTHPYDEIALDALEKYSEMRKAAIRDYEALYGPIFPFNVSGDDNCYKWVKEPFPWEKEV